jgi:hypothetical protein
MIELDVDQIRIDEINAEIAEVQKAIEDPELIAMKFDNIADLQTLAEEKEALIAKREMELAA